MQFFYEHSSGVSKKDLEETAQKLVPYISRLNTIAKKQNYEDDESSINLPFDHALHSAVRALKHKKTSRELKYIIVIGIGGSNLGAKAVYDALGGCTDIVEPDRFPKIIFADTLDPESAWSLKNFLTQRITNPEEILVNAISKSGSTLETIAYTEFIMNILCERFAHAFDRLVVTTDSASRFSKEAALKQCALLEIPQKIGGRFSVLSSVGLFPLACAGINIFHLLEGAQEMRTTCLASDMAQNPAALSAGILFWHAVRGIRINDNFMFHSELESLGKWYRQLLGESIGKEHNVRGETIHAGITPTVSIGSTDLHSVGQLYIGGPKDKITTLVCAKSQENSQVPESTQFGNLVPDIKGKSFYTIMNAIFEGVKTAYKNAELPFMEIALSEISPRELGAFMQFKMIEVMCLGFLLNVNAFDQPHVEAYKNETKKILHALP